MSELSPMRQISYGVGAPPYDLTPIREYLYEHGADAYWDYVPESEDDEGESIGGFWQAVAFKEERRRDDKVYMQFITISAGADWGGYKPALDLHLRVLEMAWQALLEREGVA